MTETVQNDEQYLRLKTRRNRTMNAQLLQYHLHRVTGTTIVQAKCSKPTASFGYYSERN